MDWSLCFLCQSGRMNGKLINPLNSNNKHKDSAYVSFEKHLLEFDRIGALPSNIRIKNLDEGNGISNTLEKNNAIYHHNCAADVSASRLSRKRPLNNNENSSAKKTRNCVNAVYESDCCFFCDEKNGILHKVTSEDLDKKVRKCANYLGDTRILTKLAIYDMRTLNASYHNLCLSKLYKRSEVKKERVLTDSAFHSVVDYIKSKALFKYKLSDLTMLYLEKIELGNPDLPVPKPNATRFKENFCLLFLD